MTFWITVAGYLSFVVLALVVWLYSRKHHTKIAKVSELFDRIMHHRATRVALVLAWWWIGWHFLVNQVKR
jgi:hypothetical protein